MGRSGEDVIRVRNKEASVCAARKEEFRNYNGTMFGQWKPGAKPGAATYVVYSYGEHFPMYVWSDDQWFENEDKYSRTTALHMTQARPTSNTIKMDTIMIMRVARTGYTALVKDRLRGGKRWMI